MASKIAWLVGKRGIILVVAAVVAAMFGGRVHSYGLWDGPH